MKRLIPSITLLLMMSIMTAAVHGEETKSATPMAPAAPVEKQSSTDGSISRKGPAMRVKVKARGSFTGTVAQVDPFEKTLTLRNRGVLVTFDAANPIFKGYRNLGDVKKGQTVSVSYSDDGLFIGKGTQSVSEKSAAKVYVSVSKSGVKATPQKKAGGKYGKSALVRVAERSAGKAFDDIDENKDGRVTAVELSVAIPGLTLQEFKKYDQNGDGCLDRREYNSIKRQ